MKEAGNLSKKKGNKKAKGSSFKQKGGKMGKGKKPRKEHFRKNSSKTPQKNANTQKPSEQHNPPKPHMPTLRKRVDPETAKYFLEIANLFESNGVDLEEQSAICGNALEETSGKEVELATDMIISRTLQCLLEGCELEQLCGFLHNCAYGFPSIAMDKSGSHVAESALKSLAIHLQDKESYSIIENTLTRICQVLVVDAVSIMCSSYGSHVLRSLLCLCKGVPLDSLEEFHVTKQSSRLAERLNSKPPKFGGSDQMNFQHGFPDIFKFLVREMLNHSKDDITTLRVNKYSSFVLQACLNLLVGDDEELLHAIRILLGFHGNDVVQGKIIETSRKHEIMALLEDTASSHLFEVIIKVAPVALYNEFLSEVFKGSLFELSSHQCGNFVVQALVSSAKSRDQMELIWAELGTRIEGLLDVGKPGVVASILATCQRLNIYVHECCHALAAAVGSQSESPRCIVPHLLFLESYFWQKSQWKWPMGNKMHTLGCLMLQTIFRCSSQFIRPYITSITSMEADHIFETAKDVGGSRVLEAFLCSDASARQKVEVISKLQDHFGELSLHPSSSFTVEKCFTACNVPLKEAIATELLAAQTELSKTRHGPYLLKKLDIDGFARRPDQWKKSQLSKETTYREFQAAFGSETKLGEQTEASTKPSKRTLRDHDKSDEISCEFPASTTTVSPGLKFSDLDRGNPAEVASAKLESGNKNFIRNSTKSSTFVRKSEKRKSSSDDIGRAKIGDGSKKCIRNRPKSGTFVGKSEKRKTSADDIGRAKIGSGGKKFIRNRTESSTFVGKSEKRKTSADELADLAGKQTLSSNDVNRLFRATVNEKNQSGNERKPFLKKQKR